ncbi:MAG: glycosyltransferase family 4 protein [Anaerolineae bacterium]
MKHIVVCNAQSPFVPTGGAEVLAQGLVGALEEHGFAVDQVNVPFTDDPRPEVMRSAMAWRMLNLDQLPGRPEKIDAVICLKYPSYVVRHPCKIVWLIHQHRPAYDLKGTPYSDFSDSATDLAYADMIRRLDNQTLGEAQGLYAISRNVARRLKHYNGLRAQALYPPPQYVGRYRCDGYGDFVFTVSRQDPLKRVDLLIRGLAQTRTKVRAVIAGTGPLLEAHRALAAELGVADRVEFVGFVDEGRLLQLYAEALAVYYAPYDEDYGYVTLEGFLSQKAVVTARDSGGTLEFVRDRETGVVFDAGDMAGLGRALDGLMEDRGKAERMGEAGYRRVAGITWDAVVDTLTGLIP